MVKSDILVASHHGSRSFFTDEANDTIDIQKNPDTTYMEAIEHIDPDVTLISCGKYETYHHPNKEAEALYKNIVVTAKFIAQTIMDIYLDLFQATGTILWCPRDFAKFKQQHVV